MAWYFIKGMDMSSWRGA